MILKKQGNSSAHWDHTNNKWWVGESYTYRWVDNKNKPASDWMDFDGALSWIKQYDETKHNT